MPTLQQQPAGRGRLQKMMNPALSIQNAHQQKRRLRHITATKHMSLGDVPHVLISGIKEMVAVWAMLANSATVVTKVRSKNAKDNEFSR
mmetsp:Transcript_116975/g.184009  ORF Transcript_116975/g.184009 Transcript_116975/m.184009 type:complete len:89 (+) Transcript_116975:819-1085(+)